MSKSLLCPSKRLRIEFLSGSTRIQDEEGHVLILDLDLRHSLTKLSTAMNLRQRNGRWYLRLWLNGSRRELATGETDYDMALLKISEIVRRETQDPSKKALTFTELVNEYIPYAERNKAESTFNKEKSNRKLLLEVFGSKKLSEITNKDVETYMLRRRKDVGPATVNRSLNLLRHILRKAVEWGYLKENPVARVKPFKEPAGRIRWLNDSERERLLDECKRSKNFLLHEIVFTALNTGMRKSELLRLSWQDIDFETGIITVRETKNNETRHLPISKVLFLVLSKLRNDIPHGHYVFSKLDGTSWGSWDLAFKISCRRASLKDFRFHDLRHTFGSYLGMANYNAFTIMKLMGLKTLAMAARYTHISGDHLRSAVDTVGGKLGKIDVSTPEAIS